MADMSQMTEALIGGASTAMVVMKWGGIALMVIGIVSGIFVWYFMKKRYIYTIKLWGLVGGIPDEIGQDVARPIKVRTKEGINSLLYIKKLKKYIKMPERDFIIGNKIKFWYRKDGELTPIKPVRITLIDKLSGNKGTKLVEIAEKNGESLIPLALEDVAQKMIIMGVKFIDEDMRLAHASTAKIIKDLFSINKFFKEYGHTLLMIVGVLILGITAILIFDGTAEYYKNSQTVSEAIGIQTNSINNQTNVMNERTLLMLRQLDEISDVEYRKLKEISSRLDEIEQKNDFEQEILIEPVQGVQNLSNITT